MVNGRLTDANIIAQLAVNTPAQDQLSVNEEVKELQVKTLLITSEAVVHIYEL